MEWTETAMKMFDGALAELEFQAQALREKVEKAREESLDTLPAALDCRYEIQMMEMMLARMKDPNS